MAHQILIVENDINFLEAVKNILNRAGYETISCTSYTNVLSCLEANKIDLILTEVFLKEYNGGEILSIIKSNPDFSGIPIIFTTVLDKAEITFDGNHEVLIKPFVMQTLIATIEYYLGRNQAGG